MHSNVQCIDIRLMSHLKHGTTDTSSILFMAMLAALRRLANDSYLFLTL